MAKKFASRSAQWPLVQEFDFNFNDWCVDVVDGLKKTFGAAVTNSQDPATGETVPGLTAGTGVILDVIPMPVGAYLTGFEAYIVTAFAGIGAGATIKFGIEGSDAALVASTDLDAATAGALTNAAFSPLLCNNGQNIRMTIAGMTATASAGKVRVRATYTIDGRVHEVTIN